MLCPQMLSFLKTFLEFIFWNCLEIILRPSEYYCINVLATPCFCSKTVLSNCELTGTINQMLSTKQLWIISKNLKDENLLLSLKLYKERNMMLTGCLFKIHPLIKSGTAYDTLVACYSHNSRTTNDLKATSSNFSIQSCPLLISLMQNISSISC